GLESEAPALHPDIHALSSSKMVHALPWDGGALHSERRHYAGQVAKVPWLPLTLRRDYGRAGRLDSAARRRRERKVGPGAEGPRAQGVLPPDDATECSPPRPYAGAVFAVRRGQNHDFTRYPASRP